MKRLVIVFGILGCISALNFEFIMPDQVDQLREKVPGYYPLSRNIDYMPPIHNGKLSVDVKNIILDGITQFTLKMDAALSSMKDLTADENVVFSPVSLAGNLGLILLAAKGNTFQEISQTLGLLVNTFEYSALYYGQVHTTFGQLLGMIDKTDSSLQTKYASGIFIQSDYEIKYDFRWNSKEIYKADVMNFTQVDIVKEIVNSWVRDKTRGKILEMITDNPNPRTQIIFASALYFNGEWSQPFNEQATQRRPFKIEPNQLIDIELMFNYNQFPYHESKELGVKIIGLPYKNSNVTMYALLPKAEGAKALKNFKETLNPLILEDLIKKMKSQECIVAFPKMKLTSTLHLKDTLQSLGMKSLFNDADLSSGFTSFKNNPSEYSSLVVEDVLHSVEISINERGTEATSATVISTIDKINNKGRFITNRPFIFFIRHDITKLILFWGSIYKPTPNYEMDDDSQK